MPMIPGFPIESSTFLSHVINVRGLKLHQGWNKLSQSRLEQTVSVKILLPLLIEVLWPALKFNRDRGLK